MKAIVYEKYGLPDVLELIEVEKPKPKPNEVLVKVHAASVNSSDCEFLLGYPLYVRMWGLFKPKHKILGSDVSGIIEEIGNSVTEFKVGDKIFADNFDTWGAFAEYVCINQKKVMIKPKSITFEQVAAIPQSSTVALQALEFGEGLTHDDHVLIVGAGGGAGSFAIQIAKYYEAHVTAVDSSIKQEFMKSAGADIVLDYTDSDYLNSNVTYDIIVDFVGKRSISDFKKALNKNGSYVMVGGSLSRILKNLFLGKFISIFTNKKMGILAHKQNRSDLAEILELFNQGQVLPLIDKVYKLENCAEGINHVFKGRAKGKVVITYEN